MNELFVVRRASYLEIPEGRKILTVYWTSKVDKYWRQGGE
jgi:general stress protein 26